MTKKKYKIFAGLGGGFGGAEELYVDEFNSIEDANTQAEVEAFQIYESYEGFYGISSIQDIIDELLLEDDKEGEDINYENEAEEIYLQEIQNWINYWAEEVVEDDLPSN